MKFRTKTKALYLIYFILILSPVRLFADNFSQSWQGDEVAIYDCVGDAKIYFLHLRAAELLQNTLKIMEKYPESPLLHQGFSEYFNIKSTSVKGRDYILKIKDILRSINQNYKSTKYYCEFDHDSFLCPKSVIARSVIFFDRVYLCARFNQFTQNSQKIGEIMHHWTHLYGGWSISKSHVSCEKLPQTATSILINQSKSFMLLTYFVGSGGRKMPCY